MAPIALYSLYRIPKSALFQTPKLLKPSANQPKIFLSQNLTKNISHKEDTESLNVCGMEHQYQQFSKKDRIEQKESKTDRNRQKGTKTNRNGQKRTETDRNGQKWKEADKKRTETDKNGQKRTETDRNRQKRTKTKKN